MKYRSLLMPAAMAVSLISGGLSGAKGTPEEAAAQEKLRAAIPLGGNFEPKPEEGVFVAAGHCLNVVVSRDDAGLRYGYQTTKINFRFLRYGP